MVILRQKFKEIYNKEKHQVICPVKCNTETLKNLTDIGCKILGEIDMPFNFPSISFYLVQLPKDFKPEVDDKEDECLFYFTKNGLARLVVNYLFLHTNVLKKYYISMGCVLSVCNEGSEEYSNPIYKPTNRKDLYDLVDAEKDCKKWLDKNKPDWKNPDAYWEDKYEKSK